MKDGDLSNKPAPRILFHYTYLMEEIGWRPFKRLQWRNPTPKSFSQSLLNENVCVSILSPDHLLTQIKEKMGIIPYNSVLSYRGNDEIGIIAHTSYLNIVEYYDKDSARGQLFGLNRWRDDD